MGKFLEKMQKVKKMTKQWEIQKKEGLRSELKAINGKLLCLYGCFGCKIPDKETYKQIEFLQNKKLDLLRIEELTWKLKCRNNWLKEGDLNTKFFHKCANDRRNKNTIWHIQRADGHIASSTQEILMEAFNHFSSFYNEDSGSDPDCQQWVLQHTHYRFDDEANNALWAAVTKEEVISTLKSFANDKCPGLDGWPAEFCIHFIDIMAAEITTIVEQGRILEHIPSTFLALIPKSSEPLNFKDFRPIALCNIIYKISSKVIANRIKPTLSKSISLEQYGFLKGRSIHDAIGIAQKVLHSMHSGKKEGLILKIDLLKAYDRVDWSYIRLMLLKVGVPVGPIRRIMGCISSVWYAVLVNGIPTPFFGTGRGLRQGCALSPLIFIMIMDGFSCLMKMASNAGFIAGFSFSNTACCIGETIPRFWTKRQYTDAAV